MLTSFVAAALLAAACPLAPASPPPAGALESFPYRHVSVVPGDQAPGTPAPPGTLYVAVDDGTAVPRTASSFALPADGTARIGPAYTDPTRCDIIDGQVHVCWRYEQRVGDQVRIWTTWQGTSCVLVADLSGRPTRLNCAGTWKDLSS